MHAPIAEDQIKKVCLYGGLIALAAGIAMAFEYGRAMSNLHAISLSLLAIAGSVGFIGAKLLKSKGMPTAAKIMTIATVGFLIGEYGTHFGYTVGHRVRDSQETGVQNATYKAVQENRESEKANLAMWKDQLKTLMEQNAWAATVKADGLRAQLEAAQKSIDLEAARGGCKAKCQQEMKKKADLEQRISTAEQANDLTKRIEATQRILDQKVEKAATTEFKSSKIVNQTQAFAQIAMWDDKPSEAALTWTQLVLGAVIAAITTYLAPFFFAIAFADIGDLTKRPNGPQERRPMVGSAPNAVRFDGKGPAGLVMTCAA